MNPYLVAGYKQGIKQAESQIAKRAIQDHFDDQVQVALKRKSLNHALLAVGTTKAKLQALLLKAVQEGWGVQELALSIRKMFDVDSRTRSLRIARTELTDSINDGTTRTLQKEGFTQKEWSTVIDGAERESHHKANGQVVGINELFRLDEGSARYPGDEYLPASERVNCRCITVGAGLTEDRKQALGQRFLRVHVSLERKFVVALRAEFARQQSRVLSHFPSD